MKTITIAIVENVTIFREGYCGFVQDCGFQLLIAASDKEEAITHFKAKKIPDICMGSIELFQSDEGTFVKQVKACWPNIKLLAYSKYDDPHCSAKALVLGIDGSLEVTADQGRFFNLIQELHNSSLASCA